MMDVKIKEALLILGFVESVQVGKLPKLKFITKKYHKLAQLHHPDRPGGDGEVFKPITEAYRLIGEYLEEHRNEEIKEEGFDFEEEVARKTFKQFQFSNIKENMKSFTIPIENSQSFTWDKVLTKHYGIPADRKHNGLHWKVVNYTDGNTKANLTISKWHIPKSDNQSKLNVHSNNAGNILPAHFVDHILPKLFQEVSMCRDLELQDMDKDTLSKKESKLKPVNLKCKECDFVGKTGNGLSSHTRLAHKKAAKVNDANIKQTLEKGNTITVEEFAIKFRMNEVNTKPLEVENEESEETTSKSERKDDEMKNNVKKVLEKNDDEKKYVDKKDDEKKDDEIKVDDNKDKDNKDDEKKDEEKKDYEKKDDEKKDDEKYDDEMKGDEKKDDEMKGDEKKDDEKKDDEKNDDEMKDDEKKDDEKKETKNEEIESRSDKTSSEGVETQTTKDNEIMITKVFKEESQKEVKCEAIKDVLKVDEKKDNQKNNDQKKDEEKKEVEKKDYKKKEDLKERGRNTSEKKSDLVENIPKKKQTKPRSSVFSCKHCEKKFAKITLLTNHLKTCHTTVNDSEGGNAITVNSPFLSDKHFFCHCAICGSGHEDYSKLSLHENKHHNYACESCDERFMVESDLNAHVKEKHTKYECRCEECGLTLKDANDLKSHKETEHKSTEPNGNLLENIRNLETKLDEKSLLLDVAFEVCEEERKRKIESDEDKAKLKNENDVLKIRCEELETKLANSESEKKLVETELLKCKKEISKAEKENKSKLNDINNEMKKYQVELKNQVEENVKLAEVNKTLAELHKTNEKISNALKTNDEQKKVASSPSDSDDDVIQIDNDAEEDEEIEDDEFVAYFAKQNDQRTTRTCPATEAQKPKQIQKYICQVCSYETENKVHLTGHMTRHNDIKCKECNLQMKTMGLYRRHMTTTHKTGSQNNEKNEEESKENSRSKVSCEVCAMESENSAHLKRHMMSAHGGDKHIYCTACDFKSSSQAQHVKHMKVAHVKNSETKSSDIRYCDICKFKATSEIHMSKHMKTAHTRPTPETKMCSFYLRGSCSYGDWCQFSHSNEGEFVTEEIPCRYQGRCLRNDCGFAHYEPFLDQRAFNLDPPVWRPW